MADVCPKCGRPECEFIDPDDVTVCSGAVYCDVWCQGFAAGYARGRRDGIDEGVRIAKENARIREGHVDPMCMDSAIEWDDVDEAAAKAKGE